MASNDERNDKLLDIKELSDFGNFYLDFYIDNANNYKTNE